MGDRCSCTLTIGGILKLENIPLLASKLLAADVSDYRKTASKIEEALKRDTCSFAFYEVNYAQMNASLQELLISLKLSFCWHNEAGSEYAAADVYYDARIDEMTEYNLIGDAISLTLDQIEKDADAVKKARKWEAFSRNMKLCVVTSNHDLLAKETAGNLPEGYLSLLSETALRAA